MTPLEQAHDIVRWCRRLADCTEVPGVTTRTFLSPPMHTVHRLLTEWMQRTGMSVSVDAAGNLRGLYAPAGADDRREAPRLLIGSHLDTVPNAGAFDGILGVVFAVALVDQLQGRRLPFAIDVIGFSDEEGTRFGAPFIGSRALAGEIDQELLQRQDAEGRTVEEAIRAYGLDPSQIAHVRASGDLIGYLEFHIEQGPILESLNLPLGIVDAIVGQSRYAVTFTGLANHAGTTPMHLRRDALAGAAEWIIEVEREAKQTPGLAATVGRVEAEPGASNVIAGRCRLTLDVRHGDDATRHDSVGDLLERARRIGEARQLQVSVESRLDQPAVAMHPALRGRLERAVNACGFPVHRMACGAGHDAMIVARRMPVAMLLLRSPGGLSHHPDESVIVEDVAAALSVGVECLEEFARG